MLRFPDLTTLQLALTSGAVPAAIAEAPAVVFEDGGAVLVRPSQAPGRAGMAALRRLGVESVRAVKGRAKTEVERQVLCWAQILPLRPDKDSALPGPSTPVLFELAATGAAALIGEILRLGNDRQSVRWLADEGAGGDHALIRVVGPPYYALLRAIDRDDGDAAPRAFTERAPRVFVEVGHAHPLADRLRPPKGRFLLIHATGDWVVLDEAPFQDIYETLEFHLPAPAVRHRVAELPARIAVPLRLARNAAHEAAELWVIGDGDVLEAVVVAGPDEVLGSVPVAYVVGRGADAEVLAATLRRRADRELARFRRPAAVHVVADLPHGPTGKISRSAVRAVAADLTNAALASA